MIVETSVTVARAMLSDDHRRWRLIQEARHRLVELGVATLDQLDQKPSITASVQEIGGEATPWVHVISVGSCPSSCAWLWSALRNS